MTRRLYRDGALADGRDDRLRRGVSILVEDGPDHLDPPSRRRGTGRDPGAVELVDASGSTIVPGMVDCHSHLTMPGGAHWIDRVLDPTDRLLEVAEANARLLTQAGVRWARDVGSMRRRRPGRRPRAARWPSACATAGAAGRDYPHVRAAGTWIMARGQLPASVGRGGRWRRAARGGDGAARRRRRPREALPRRARPGCVAVVASTSSVGWSTRSTRAARRSPRTPATWPVRGSGADGRRRLARARLRAGRRRRGTMAANGVRARVDAGRDGLVADVRDDHRPRRASPAPEGRTRAAARRERAGERRDSRTAPASRSRPGRTSAAARPRANQLAWEVEQLVEAGPRAVGGAGLRRPGGAASCWASPTRASSARAARPTSPWSTATRCPTRPRCGGSGTSRGRADRPAAAARRAARHRHPSIAVSGRSWPRGRGARPWVRASPRGTIWSSAGTT